MFQKKKDAKAEEAKRDKLILETSTYETLDRDFVAVLRDLSGDQAMDKVRVEYERLYEALKKAHESEKRLMAKCHELNAEIQANASKVQAAMTMSQDDQTLIDNLKKVSESPALSSVSIGFKPRNQRLI